MRNNAIEAITFMILPNCARDKPRAIVVLVKDRIRGAQLEQTEMKNAGINAKKPPFFTFIFCLMLKISSVKTRLENKEILNNARKIKKLNIKPKDSLHIACAIFGNCSYFITTDDLLVKRNALIEDIEIVYPTNFIELEENNDD